MIKVLLRNDLFNIFLPPAMLLKDFNLTQELLMFSFKVRLDVNFLIGLIWT